MAITAHIIFLCGLFLLSSVLQKNRQIVSVVFASQNVTGTKIKLTDSIFWYSWFAVKKNEFGQVN
jgi:hypothetical protein